MFKFEKCFVYSILYRQCPSYFTEAINPNSGLEIELGRAPSGNHHPQPHAYWPPWFPGAHFGLSAPSFGHSNPFSSYYMPDAYCLLPIAYCLMLVACRLLCIAGRLLHIACCLLSIVFCVCTPTQNIDFSPSGRSVLHTQTIDLSTRRAPGSQGGAR